MLTQLLFIALLKSFPIQPPVFIWMEISLLLTIPLTLIIQSRKPTWSDLFVCISLQLACILEVGRLLLRMLTSF